MLADFKVKQRQGVGWNKVYIRNEHPVPIQNIRIRFNELPKFLENELAVGGGPPWGGTIDGGFALIDDSGWSIYGQRTFEGVISNLAISTRQKHASPRFIQELLNLANDKKLLLVDWQMGRLIELKSLDTLSAWFAHYQS